MFASQDPMPIIDGAVANGIGTPMFVGDYRNIVLALNTASSANGTIKFQISYQKERPNFAGAQSPTNQWDYVRVQDLEDGAAIAGDTGITLSGTDDNRNLAVNVDGAFWVCGIISSYSAGAWHLDGVPKNH